MARTRLQGGAGAAGGHSYPSARVFGWLAALRGTRLLADDDGRLYLPPTRIESMPRLAAAYRDFVPGPGMEGALYPPPGYGSARYPLDSDDAVALMDPGGVLANARAFTEAQSTLTSDGQVCWVRRPRRAPGTFPDDGVPPLYDGDVVNLYRVPPTEYHPSVSTGRRFNQDHWANYLASGNAPRPVSVRIMSSTWASEPARSGADPAPACALCVWEPTG